MKKLFAKFIALSAIFIACKAYAITVYYQPTLYPNVNQPGTHIWDGWISNVPGQTFRQDGFMKVGGANRYVYRSYMKFDMDGLPKDIDYVYLWLVTHTQTTYPTVPYAVCQVGSGWDTAMTWQTQPTFKACSGFYSAPTPNRWTGFWLAYPGGSPNWYNEWRNGTIENNGIMIYPQSTLDSMDVFYSSRYNDYGYNKYADAFRPTLAMSFAPTLQLKMPLPGNHKWLVTTEVGGWDCKGDAYDIAHDDALNIYGVMQYNYFSIDFSWKSVPDEGATVYQNPDPEKNRRNNGVYIPVIAAAAGTVVFSSIHGQPDVYNGYYVVIDHDGDQKLDTGFQTRYIHLQPPGPLVSKGDVVQQGDKLGYVGNTGWSNGAHLHFGVRYMDSGSKNVSELTRVVMDGWILKSFQSECLNGTWNRFYRSGNRVY